MGSSQSYALQRGCWCSPFAPERAGNKTPSLSKRVSTDDVALLFPCIVLKGQFSSAQGLIKLLPKVRGRGACITCRVCWYSRFSGMAQPGPWHSYIESCLQYINELELSLAWSVSTLTPTVLKEFPICFFPLIREPLGHNRAFWEVHRPSSSAESEEGWDILIHSEDNLQLPKRGCKQDSSYKC